MSRARAPELFSFSFLDILACTVGAVVFVLLVLSMQVSETTPQALPKAERDRVLDRIRAAKEELEAPLEPDAVAESGDAELESLAGRIEALEDEVRQAEERAEARERELEDRRPPARELPPIRPSPARVTDKSPGLVLICLPEGVETVRVEVGPPSGDPPTRTARFERLALTPPERLADSRSGLGQRLKAFDRRKQYVWVLLREGSIEVFRQLRDYLDRWGYDVAWEPLPVEGREVRVSGGAGRPRTD